ncbi:MAG TPA: type II toxin-antitoxin system RelE/ParE family toxin [Aurantimonas coralicida]|uniref:Type II toxin-antitoxin system RelE/ParE family toxin n=2 Tax=root TaxID=1 RepID=A0A9C9NIU2_9HYPH|nr:type II toxin-antitoxin system RelE/ParE family toxin [Aurantimonas coralicida]HEU02321.1 type II toxin-antitoxin system RelE/ParE family toxin [Aurantimonas coralicida]
MILSFKGKHAKAIGDGKVAKGFPADLVPATERKLQMVEDAAVLDDLRSPPGNRLEALKGNRKGQHSVRINNQWRICFRWTAAGPEDVEITDYHA